MFKVSKPEPRENLCPTCNKPSDKPYRVYFEQSGNTRIMQGCVDAFHEGALSGDDLDWHNRHDAVRVRKHMAERLASLVS